MSADDFERAALELLSEALDQPSTDRADWVARRCGAETALAERVFSLLDMDAAGARLLRTGGVTDDIASPPRPQRVGPYRITGLIGEGGMGAVYTGERDLDDFDQQVAIKVVRPGVLSDALVARFERERQILAKLNHPHIARLYTGGATEDGLPYMAMELVDGDPIVDWAEARGLSLGARLDLFMDLCGAVAFAHQNLVIHRDITPSNVLVTESGVVKLIDFGISKPQDGDAPDAAAPDEPAVASMSYTPGYAAPEREQGAPASTLSDIYSLGKLLAALTQSAPHPADLDAIIAKASAPNPAKRYSSADALTEDLRAFRTGYPVKARGGGAGYRFGRYVRRHWLGVSLATTAVALLVGGLVSTTWLYQRAEAERVAADQRFEEVRSLANFMIFDLYDELEKVPGNTRSIAMLAEEAQGYLDSLSADSRASLDVTLEAIGGYRRLADILGNPNNANLGLRADSEAMMERALSELQALHVRFPNDPAVMRTLAETAFSNSVQQYVSIGDNELAIARAGIAAGLYEDLLARNGDNFEDRRQLLRARLMGAVPLPWLGRAEEGKVQLKDILAGCEALVADYPDRIEALQLLGSLNVEVARAIIRQPSGSDDDSDIPYWDEAIRLRELVYTLNPEDSRPYRSLATIYYERGASHRGLGNFDQALADVLRSEEIAHELLALDPDDDWLLSRVEGAAEEKARTLSYAGRHEEAVVQARRAMEIARESNGITPDNPGRLREWGYSQVLFAEVFLSAGELAEGCALAIQARRTWDQVEAVSELSDLDRNRSLALLTELEAQCLG